MSKENAERHETEFEEIYLASRVCVSSRALGVVSGKHYDCLERFDGDAESKTTARTLNPVGMRTRKLCRRPRRRQALE